MGKRIIAVASPSLDIMDEIAEFFATSPTPDQILNYRLPKAILRRASELLRKNREGTLTQEEDAELDRFEHAELLLQAVLARIRAKRAKRT
jgi:hypothetical protein